MARVIIAGAFVVAQPVRAETATQPGVRAADNAYTALLNYVEANGPTNPGLSDASRASAGSDDYSKLSDFVLGTKTTASALPDNARSVNADQTVVVAAADIKPPKVKKPVAADDAGGYAKDDPKTCLTCHGDNPNIQAFLKFSAMARKGDPNTPMAGGGCESCHGASAAHVASRMKGGDGEPAVVFAGANASPVEDRNAVCQGCHEGGMLINWQGSAMQRAGVACTSCHTVHAAKDPVRDRKTEPEVCFACHTQQAAETREYSHHPIREGKVVCSDCHNPMGSAGPHLLKEFSVNETCYNCHADKRGPMLWEHQPVREDCTNCHTPHGSTEARLMKENMGFMCSSCHSGNGSNNSGGAFGGLASVPGHSPLLYSAELANQRLCLNCHSQVHGSNSPNGAFFFR